MLHSGIPTAVLSAALQSTPAGGRFTLRAALGATVRAAAGLRARTQRARRYAFHFEHTLGTSFELQLVATSAAAARRAEAAALAEIDRLDAVLSGYSETSELSRWLNSKATCHPVSAELGEVLEAAEYWRVKTGGAFNPAAVALAAKPHVAADCLWSVNRQQGVATRCTALLVSLDAIAKGFIVDRVAQCVGAMHGVTGVLVNIGGDLRHVGDTAVAVAVCDPSAPAENAPPIGAVRVRNAALATSGGYRRTRLVDGQLASHIVDARTGMSATRIASASVFANDCVTADALSTAFSVMTPQESVALADTLPSVGCLLVESNGAVTSNFRWNRAALSPSIHTSCAEG